jgi:hypothetical protein
MISGARRFTAFLVLALASAAAAQSPAAVSEDARRKAEALYNDVYGAEHAAVHKSTVTADKLAFAKKLADAAKLADEDKALVRVLIDNALKFAVSDPAGLRLAAELLKARAAGDPADRPAALEALVDVYEKSLRAETKASARHAPARELVVACLECAAVLPAERVADSLALLVKARTACRTHIPATDSRDLLKSIDAAETELQERKRLTERLAAAEARLKSSPDGKARSEAAVALLRLNRRAGALAHAQLSDLEPLRKLGSLLSSETPNPVEVADAFRALAESFPADRAYLLGQARDWYEKALAADPKHPDAVRIKLILTQLPAREPAPATATEPTTKTSTTGAPIAKTKTAVPPPPAKPMPAPVDLKTYVEQESAKLTAAIAPNAGKNLRVQVRGDGSQVRVRADRRMAAAAQQLAAAIRKIKGVRDVEIDVND